MSDAALDLAALLAAVKSLAVEAGEAALATADAPGTARKPDGSPITRGDAAAHQVLVDGLTRLTPDILIISEESAPHDIAGHDNYRRVWLVDPLDGTREFVRRSKDFAVNIALVEDGAPVIGVVHAPARGTTWWAHRGGGAFRARQDDEDEPRPLRTRLEPGAGFRIVASRDHGTPELNTLLRRVPLEHVARLGSSIKFCLVAEGTADFYPRFGTCMEWDTCAPQLIVEEAGGQVVDFDGRALRYNKADLRNPPFICTGDPAFDWRSWL